MASPSNLKRSRRRPRGAQQATAVELATGQRMPLVGLGTWKSPPGKVGEAVKHAIRCGYRLIDCANDYGNEAEIGRALRELMDAGEVKREEIFVQGKLWNTNHRKIHVEGDLTATLRDLQLDYLDSFLIHWPQACPSSGRDLAVCGNGNNRHAPASENPMFPVAEDGRYCSDNGTRFMEAWYAMEELADRGLTRSIGLSNFNRCQIEEVLTKTRKHKPAVLQNECHPYLQQKDLLDFCRIHGIVFQAYSPLGSYDRPWAKAGDRELLNDKLLEELAEKHGKTPAQVVLRWHIQRGSCAVPKSVTPERILENLSVFDFELSPEDMSSFDRLNIGRRFCLWPETSLHPDYPFKDDLPPVFEVPLAPSNTSSSSRDAAILARQHAATGPRASRLSPLGSLARRWSGAEALAFSRFPFLKELGLAEENEGVFDGKWGGSKSSAWVTVSNPATNEPVARVRRATVDDYRRCIDSMNKVHSQWANMPAPARGIVVRKIGDALRRYQKPLGHLVSLEMGKIIAEGIGEVQEAIDICDFAVGLSRTLNGSVIPSERPDHFMMERYNPLNGHVGVITAFNFPVAVWFWNAAISLVCGNTNIWKPASTATLSAVACTRIVQKVLEEEGMPGALTCLAAGDSSVGEAMINDPTIELLSFTGSTEVGRHVSERIASRFGKHILELGGNNAMVVLADANMELAVRATVFSAVGTAGQRCTSLRRVYVEEPIYKDFVQRLVKAYGTVRIGDPLKEGTLMGPLHTKQAVRDFAKSIEEIKGLGATIAFGGRVLSDRPGNYVEPTIVTNIDPSAKCVQRELFAPVLYVMRVKNLDEAIRLNNAVPQGLSSSLFTTRLDAALKWTGPLGADSGIVNVNIGPSGAEIGGAFGGEKETGGGRESGSDSWKQYMRRSTCTVNYGQALPLAQGIKFD